MLPLSQKTLLALILFITAIFVSQWATPELFENRKIVPAELESAWHQILSGTTSTSNWLELTTLLTAALMHGGVDHILFNMLFLWIFAGLVGELLGARWMLTIFFLTAICGSVGDVILRSGEHIPSLGASGAVMGFEGAYLGLAVRWSLPWPRIWPIAHPIPPMRLVILAVVGFGFDISGTITGTPGIAYGAHLGGFIAGLFLTSFITPRPKLDSV